jgi:hypothetical protein
MIVGIEDSLAANGDLDGADRFLPYTELPQLCIRIVADG